MFHITTQSAKKLYFINNTVYEHNKEVRGENSTLSYLIKLAPCPQRLSVGQSSDRTVHPGLAPAIVRKAFVRRSFRSFAGGSAVPLTTSGKP